MKRHRNNNFLSVALNTATESSCRMEAPGKNVEGTGDCTTGPGEVDCMVCVCLPIFNPHNTLQVKYFKSFVCIPPKPILNHKDTVVMESDYIQACSKTVHHTAGQSLHIHTILHCSMLKHCWIPIPVYSP